MSDTIKHVCLDCCVMNHILKNQLFSYFERMVKAPRTQKISRKATIASKTVSIFFSGTLHLHRLCSSHFRLIWHLKTVGHVASETDIKNCCFDILVLNDVHNLCHQHSGLPCKGTAWFEDDFEPRIPLMEFLEHRDEQFDVIVIACHEVTSAEVYPFKLGKPLGELVLNMDKCALEHIRPALAMAMAMKSLDVGRKCRGQFVGRDTESCPGRARVI